MLLEQIWFSLSRVLPYFTLILLGILLRRSGMFSAEFFGGLNKFAYRVALPCSMFMYTYPVEWANMQQVDVLVYLAFITIAVFFALWALAEIVYRKQKHLIGTVVQGTFRGNYAILGMPLLLGVLDDSWLPAVSLAVGILIPMYSIFSVVVLLIRPARPTGKRLTLMLVVTSILHNPLVVGCFAGFILAGLSVPIPGILYDATGMLAATGNTLTLVSIGGVLDWKLAKERIPPAVFASAIKNFIVPVLVVTISYFVGFRGPALFYLFVVFANPNSTSAYPNAIEMGGDGPLAANIIMITTVVSAFVLAGGISVMRMVGWI